MEVKCQKCKSLVKLEYKNQETIYCIKCNLNQPIVWPTKDELRKEDKKSFWYGLSMIIGGVIGLIALNALFKSTGIGVFTLLPVAALFIGLILTFKSSYHLLPEKIHNNKFLNGLSIFICISVAGTILYYIIIYMQGVFKN